MRLIFKESRNLGEPSMFSKGAYGVIRVDIKSELFTWARERDRR